jgi:hypothetical protein
MELFEELIELSTRGIAYLGCLPATYNAVVAGSGAEVTTPGIGWRTRNAEDRSILDGYAAEGEGVGVVIDVGQVLADRNAARWCNRNRCTAGREDDSVERRVVSVNLRIVRPGVRVGEDYVNRIVANAQRVRVVRVDVLACAEWRLRRFIRDAGVGIDVVVGKSTDIGGTFPLLVFDESPEDTSVIGFAARIDPARAIHGAVGICAAHCLVGGVVLAGIAGAEGLPVVAGGIGDVAVHGRLSGELVLSAVRETGYSTVSTFWLSVVTQDDKAKNLTEGALCRHVRALEPECRGTSVVRSQIISMDRHRIVRRGDSGVS